MNAAVLQQMAWICSSCTLIQRLKTRSTFLREGVKHALFLPKFFCVVLVVVIINCGQVKLRSLHCNRDHAPLFPGEY